jgi:hypothetical protein
MDFVHVAGLKPAGALELGRGADGVALEVRDHPELVLTEMNITFFDVGYWPSGAVGASSTG